MSVAFVQREWGASVVLGGLIWRRKKDVAVKQVLLERMVTCARRVAIFKDTKQMSQEYLRGRVAGLD